MIVRFFGGDCPEMFSFDRRSRDFGISLFVKSLVFCEKQVFHANKNAAKILKKNDTPKPFYDLCVFCKKMQKKRVVGCKILSISCRLIARYTPAALPE